MAYIGKSPSVGIRNRFLFTATSGQTTFSGADDDSRTLSYTDAKFLDIYLNGVLLDPNTDYTATTGTSVVLAEGAATDDLVEIIAFDTFSLFDGTFEDDVTVGRDLSVTRNVSVTGSLGVGVTNPSTSLDVVRAGVQPLRIESTSGTEVQINMVNTGGNVQLEAHSGNFNIDADAVGIGVTNPDTPLEISTTGSGVTNVLKLTTTGEGTVPSIVFEGDQGGTQHTAARIRAGQEDSSNGNIIFEVEDAGSLEEAIRVDSSGRMLLNHTSSVSAGLGGSQLQIHGTNAATGSATIIRNSDDNNPSYLVLGKSRSSSTGGVQALVDGDLLGRIDFVGGNGTNVDGRGASIYAEATQTFRSDSSRAELVFATTTNGSLSSVERMRVISNALCIGKDSGVSSVAGIAAFTYGELGATRSGGTPLLLNRLTSDGDLIELRRENTARARIGITSTDNLYIDATTNGGAGLQFWGAGGSDPYITPREEGSDNDNLTSLGRAANRFKDLYLGGGLYVGGTGSANYLDDYEEGTWTPDVKLVSSGSSTHSYRVGTYTKVGNLCTLSCIVETSAHSGSGTCYIHGLPFAHASSAESIGSCQMNAHSDSHSTDIGSINSIIQSGESVMHMRATYNTNASGPLYIQLQNFTYLRITITYRTA